MVDSSWPERVVRRHDRTDGRLHPAHPGIAVRVFPIYTHGMFMAAVDWRLVRPRTHTVTDMRAFLDFQKALRIAN